MNYEEEYDSPTEIALAKLIDAVKALHAPEPGVARANTPTGLVLLDLCSICRDGKGSPLPFPCPTMVALGATS